MKTVTENQETYSVNGVTTEPTAHQWWDLGFGIETYSCIKVDKIKIMGEQSAGKELQFPPPGASLPQGDPCPNAVYTPPGFSLNPRPVFPTAVISAHNSSATPWSNVHYTICTQDCFCILGEGLQLPKILQLSFQSWEPASKNTQHHSSATGQLCIAAPQGSQQQSKSTKSFKPPPPNSKGYCLTAETMSLETKQQRAWHCSLPSEIRSSKEQLGLFCTVPSAHLSKHLKPSARADFQGWSI